MTTGLDPWAITASQPASTAATASSSEPDLPEGDRAAGMDALHHGGVRITPEHIDDAGATGASSSSPVLAGRSKAKNPTPTGRSVRSWTRYQQDDTHAQVINDPTGLLDKVNF